MPARPRSVTLLALGVFTLGVVNIWRVLVLMGQLDLLQGLGAAVDPRIRLILAFVWALLFLEAAILLWRRRPISRLIIPLLLTLYAVYHFGLTFFFVQSPVARQGWPFDLLIYTLAILFSCWALNRRGVQPYFRDRQESVTTIEANYE